MDRLIFEKAEIFVCLSIQLYKRVATPAFPEVPVCLKRFLTPSKLLVRALSSLAESITPSTPATPETVSVRTPTPMLSKEETATLIAVPVSETYSMLSSDIGSQKLGQPEPESNFEFDEKSSSPQHVHLKELL